MLVLLLVAKDVPVDLSGSARSEPKLTAYRILVIEDEPVIALDLVMILVDQGADVIGPAVSDDEALGFLEQVAIDLVP